MYYSIVRLIIDAEMDLLTEGMTKEEINALLICALCYFYLQRVSSEKDYIPVPELLMVLDSFDGLPNKSTVTPHLVSLLVFFANDIAKKSLKDFKHHEKIIIKTLSLLNEESFALLDQTIIKDLAKLAKFNFLTQKKIFSLSKEHFNIKETLIDFPRFPNTENKVEAPLPNTSVVEQIVPDLGSVDLEKYFYHLLVLYAQKNGVSIATLVLILKKMYQPDRGVLLFDTFFDAYEKIYKKYFHHIKTNDQLNEGVDNDEEEALNNLKKSYEVLEVLLIGIKEWVPILFKLFGNVFLDSFITFINKSCFRYMIDYLASEETQNLYGTLRANLNLISGLAFGRWEDIREGTYSGGDFLLQIFLSGDALSSLAIFSLSSRAKKFSLAFSASGWSVFLAGIIKEKKLDQSFTEFMTHFKRVNDKAGSYQKVSVYLFFVKYGPQIKLLLQLMGSHAINGMLQLVANTVLPLTNMLETIPSSLSLELDDDGEELLKKFKIYCDAQVTTSAKFSLFHQYLAVFKSIAVNRRVLNEVINAVTVDQTPQQLLTNTMIIVLKNIFPKLPIELDQKAIDALLLKTSLTVLISLVTASKEMSGKAHEEIYLELLARALFGIGSQDKFLHDVEQKSLVGQTLAKHNRYIQTRLKEMGGDADMAFRYPEKDNFILQPPGKGVAANAQETSHVFFMLWRFIVTIKEEIEKIKLEELEGRTQKDLSKIMSNILELHRKIDKLLKNNNNNISDAAKKVFSDKNFLSSIVGRNIIQTASRLQESAPSLPATFFEFVDHLKDQFSLVQKLTLSASLSTAPVSLQSNLHFEVRLWPKSHEETIFLGEHVGCCLSPKGQQFQAFCYRHVDDAVVIPVVIDRKTNKPVALIWAYFAETEDNRLVLVANFFEVKARFGLNKYQRSGLLCGLLKFIAHYLENSGADCFYMRRPSYGWYLGAFNDFPEEPVKIKRKLGGPYLMGRVITEKERQDPGMQAEHHRLTRHSYYLDSLADEKFFRFCPKVLEKLVREQNNISVTELIEQTIEKIVQMQPTIDFYKMVDQVIAAHPLDWIYFFREPLGGNKAFLDALWPAYERINILRATLGRYDSFIGLLKNSYSFWAATSRTIFLSGENSLQLGEPPKLIGP